METNHNNLINHTNTLAVRSNFFESNVNFTENPKPILIAHPKNEIKEFVQKPFIEANTIEVDMSHLKNDCIIPVFSKDNEVTISHVNFIECVLNCIQKVYPFEKVESPEIRVSHQIKGRTPDAIYKNAKDLLDSEKTIYYERFAFIVRIPSITETINGNKLSLTVGGVRAYNQENLYSKKNLEKFKFFIGFQNLVCCNLCVSTDGMKTEMKSSSIVDLQEQILNVMLNYNAEKHLTEMSTLQDYHLTEQQFAQLLGKAKLYNYLPKNIKANLPQLSFTDSQFNTIAKDYYSDESFCKQEDDNINLWKVYNLFTQASKSSYIDSFLERDLNAFDFTQGIQKALIGNGDYHWFLS